MVCPRYRALRQRVSTLFPRYEQVGVLRQIYRRPRTGLAGKKLLPTGDMLLPWGMTHPHNTKQQANRNAA